MTSELTPARVAARDQAALDRELVRELLTNCIGLFQKFDLLTVEQPITTDLHNELVSIAQLLRGLNLGVAEMIAHVPPPPRPVAHPSWPRLRDELFRLIRATRWLWANETPVHDRLVAGTWSHVDGLDLIEALRRVERLAVLFGFPLHPTTPSQE